MSFQLVRASDTEIVVWHVDHGHIFVFEIAPSAATLTVGPFHEVAGAAEPASAVCTHALDFATQEARKRHLIGERAKSRLRTSLGCDLSA